jgi:hypothetical protein
VLPAHQSQTGVWETVDGVVALKKGLVKRFRKEKGHDPTARELKRWVRKKGLALPHTDVLKTGGRVA